MNATKALHDDFVIDQIHDMTEDSKEHAHVERRAHSARDDGWRYHELLWRQIGFFLDAQYYLHKVRKVMVSCGLFDGERTKPSLVQLMYVLQKEDVVME